MPSGRRHYAERTAALCRADGGTEITLNELAEMLGLSYPPGPPMPAQAT